MGIVLHERNYVCVSERTRERMRERKKEGLDSMDRSHVLQYFRLGSNVQYDVILIDARKLLSDQTC